MILLFGVIFGQNVPPYRETACRASCVLLQTQLFFSLAVSTVSARLICWALFPLMSRAPTTNISAPNQQDQIGMVCVVNLFLCACECYYGQVSAASQHFALVSCFSKLNGVVPSGWQWCSNISLRSLLYTPVHSLCRISIYLQYS